MSGQVDPISFPQAWDQVRIANQLCPGVCEVKEFKRRHEWDKKKGKGAYGETITFIQRPAATGSIKFLLWTAQHFTDWDSFRKLLKFDPTKKTVQAVDIYHPSLADIDIKSVVTESIGNIQHEGEQLYSITVDFLEYFPPPPKSAVSTPTNSKAGSSQGIATPSGNQPPDADAALQAQIAQLMSKAAQP